MAHMSMNKIIHTAVRRDLDRFVGALTTFRPGDSARAGELATAWAHFDHQLTHHHEGEHEIAWPALESIGVSHETTVQMDAEHDVMAAALGEARTAIAALQASPGQGEAEKALASMERLREATNTHLDHEEAELEAIFLQNEGSPEMKEMAKKFRTGPAEGGVFFAWLLDTTPSERATLLSDLPVPGPVVKVLTTLFGRGYRRDIAPVWAS